ncbi:MAG TPA: response regulator transcription factor [Terriglobia bacterium]|nr:response regulator transcription factor [Terriglobia bacterium]
MAKARILIADDHAIVRRGLRALALSQRAWEVCGEAQNGREAVEMSATLKPDVAILDIGMPELNGLDAARQILRNDPRVEILILTMHQSEEVVREVLKAGARGYVLKSDADENLVKAIEALLQHKPFFTSDITDVILANYLDNGNEPVAPARPRVTTREREVIQLLCEGKSNKEVAAAFDISVRTVETHRATIMHKLGLTSLSDLVRYAIRNKIVEP